LNDAVAVCLMLIRVLQAGHNMVGGVFSCGMTRKLRNDQPLVRQTLRDEFEFRAVPNTPVCCIAAAVPSHHQRRKS
jgi:hypothetical protein